MEAIYKRRLASLYRIVSGHKDTADLKFDMRKWMRITSECGTTACAAGLYVLKSKQRELKFVAFAEDDELCHICIQSKKQKNSLSAIAEHFGMPRTTAMLIFGDTRLTKETFLRRLKKFMEHR